MSRKKVITVAAPELEPGRLAWVRVGQGETNVAAHVLRGGDAGVARGEAKITLSGLGNTEVLLFDLVRKTKEKAQENAET